MCGHTSCSFDFSGLINERLNKSRPVRFHNPNPSHTNPNLHSNDFERQCQGRTGEKKAEIVDNLASGHKIAVRVDKIAGGVVNLAGKCRHDGIGRHVRFRFSCFRRWGSSPHACTIIIRRPLGRLIFAYKKGGCKAAQQNYCNRIRCALSIKIVQNYEFLSFAQGKTSAICTKFHIETREKTW